MYSNYYKLKIFEMANSLKNIKDNLDNMSAVVLEHLAKLAILDSPQNKNHWRQEVYNFLHRTQKIKGTNKYPNSKIIFDSTWGRNGDSFEDVFIRLALTEYKDIPVKSYDIKNITENAKQYFKWLSEKLGENPVISSNEIYTKLNELGF